MDVRRSKRGARCITILASALVLSYSCSSVTAPGGESRRGSAESAEGLVLVPVSSDLAAGRNFLALAVRSADGSYFGSPDSTATVEAHLVDGSSGTITFELPFVSASQAEDAAARGYYAGFVALDTPGTWELGARLRNESGFLLSYTLRATVEVAERPRTPGPGDAAPRSLTRTSTSVGGDLSRLTSDPHPDPDLYKYSLHEVIGNGARPVVVVFATPARCKSAVCGPVVDVVKEVKRRGADAFFVHVEVYEKPMDPSDDSYVEAVREWRLPTEPWTFVIGPDGKIRDRIEGLFATHQLLASIAEAR